jgi:thioredoxin reductase (NADPH)
VPQQDFDLVVIGEGIAGLCAARCAARTGMRVATFEANLFGGLVINVTELEGYPEGRIVSGAELASELVQENAELGVASVQEAVEAVAPADGGFEVVTAATRYRARRVIAASGARLKKLGVPGEAEFAGRGVSQCADCDGPMFQGEEVVVVGGGDSALQEALVLARYCGRVHLVHRGERLRARAHYVERASASPKISILWNTAVEAILGTKMVEKVRLRDLRAGRAHELACAGVFAYVGLEPNAACLPPAVARDTRGFIVTDGTLLTSVPGLWAVGALRSGYSGRLSDAVAEAERAAQAAASQRTQ